MTGTEEEDGDDSVPWSTEWKTESRYWHLVWEFRYPYGPAALIIGLLVHNLELSHRGVDNPPAFGDFIEDNYRLLATSAIFAAIAVYFVQLVDSLGGAIELGIGAAFLLFSISILVILRRTLYAWFQATDHALIISSVGYMTIAISLFALLIALLGAIFRFPGNVRDGILYIILLPLLTVYFGSVPQLKFFKRYEDSTVFGHLSHFAPVYSMLAPPVIEIIYILWTGNRVVIAEGTAWMAVGMFLVIYATSVIVLFTIGRVGNRLSDF